MTEEFLALIVGEIREDYQIPPYTDDYVIMRSVEKCAARLESLRPGADFENDALLCVPKCVEHRAVYRY